MAGRILVLDDEENYAEMLRDLLREHGYQVDMATRPERAIARLEEIPYDLVISDYKMPVMDGAVFLKKSRELYPGLPFILVSGLMNTPELVKVANMGVTMVLEKPLDTRSFLEQVSRFSTPLTPKEQEQLVQDGRPKSGQAGGAGFPSEPHFFSVRSPVASRFLEAIWSVMRQGQAVYLLEPPGGDAELALKDLSHWSGYDDRPISEFALPDSVEDGLRKIRDVIADNEKSRLVTFRLESLAQIAIARELSKATLGEKSDADSARLAYIVIGGPDQTPEFKNLTGKQGAVLPPMRVRPSDVAVYAQRFARIATDRFAQKLSAEFTPEAGLALLAHEWPENYRQLRGVVQQVVEMTGDQPIGLEVLQQVLGSELPATKALSLTNLLQSQQGYFLEGFMVEQGLGLAGLSEALQLDTPVKSTTELAYLPIKLRGSGQ